MSRLDVQKIISLLLLALLLWFFPEAMPYEDLWSRTDGDNVPSESAGMALVVRVIDGDTLEISGGERVRLIGVDAPESVKPNSPKECFGQESSRFLRERLEAKTVRLERDVSDRDRYGRLLRYVYDGEVFINAELVRSGYATAVSYPPDVRESERLRLAEKQARTERVGLWNEAVCPQD